MHRGPIALFRPIAPDYRCYDGAAIVMIRPAHVDTWVGPLFDIVLTTGDRLTAYGDEIVQPVPPE